MSSTSTVAIHSADSSGAVAKRLVKIFEWFGNLGMFCARLVRTAVAPPYEFRELVHQCDETGSKSLPLVILAGAATGVVLSLQTRDSLIHFGAKSLLPTIIVYSVLKESGPVITGLIVSGRVGAGIGAELGSMRVTEQIDAMETSAVDPVAVSGRDTRFGLHPHAAVADALARMGARCCLDG